MHSHRFDSVSAFLAVVSGVGGLAVAFGASDAVGDVDAGLWLAIGALGAGVALIPWGRRSGARVSDTEEEEGVGVGSQR